MDDFYIDVAKDFATEPKGWFRWECAHSTEEFLDDHVIPALRKHEHVHLVLPDAQPALFEFLDGVFGGLVRRRFDPEQVRRRVHVAGTLASTLGKFVNRLIDRATSDPPVPLDSDVYIYVDSTVIQDADVDRVEWLREEHTLDWGGQTISLVTEPKYEIVDKRINQPRELLRETVALQLLAQFARHPNVTFMQQFETEFESIWSRRPSPSPPFFGVPIAKAGNPIPYQRTLFAGGVRQRNSAEIQHDFLDGLTHPRFVHLQRLAGVQDAMGMEKRRRQILDAWHLWCAERNQCTYFLTRDGKLIRSVQARRRADSSQPPTPVNLVTPSEMLRILADKVRWWNTAVYLLRGLWEVRHSARGRVHDLARDGPPLGRKQ